MIRWTWALVVGFLASIGVAVYAGVTIKDAGQLLLLIAGVLFATLPPVLYVMIPRAPAPPPNAAARTMLWGVAALVGMVLTVIALFAGNALFTAGLLLMIVLLITVTVGLYAMRERDGAASQ